MLTLLCTGDIHIGRRATRVGARAAERRYSSAAAWEAVVELAVRRRVDLVLLSGDVVDRANWYFEAFGPLERGLRALAAAGIPAVAVAGNHDVEVLPRLVASLGPENFRLLGAGGAWERWTFRRDGRPLLHIDGWSFPQEHVRQSPLEGYALPADASAPTLGLLHADLDQPRSAYAPVALDDLHRRPVALWLLGHVHKPASHEREGCPRVLYPGSPQAMDPGETGRHGPWLLGLEGGRVRRCEHVPLSAVRYDELELDLSDLHDEAALHDRLARRVRDHLHEVAAEGGPLAFVSCRVRLRGRTKLHRRLGASLRQFCDDFEVAAADDRTAARVDKLYFDTQPAVELDALARGSDLPATLARLILSLKPEDPAAAPAERQPLLRAAQAQLDRLHAAIPYDAIYESDRPPTLDDARRLLRRQALLLLDALLAQKESA